MARTRLIRFFAAALIVVFLSLACLSLWLMSVGGEAAEAGAIISMGLFMPSSGVVILLAYVLQKVVRAIFGFDIGAESFQGWLIPLCWFAGLIQWAVFAKYFQQYIQRKKNAA